MLMFHVFKLLFMKKKTYKLLIEILKAVIYALAGYFGGDVI